VNRFRDWTRRRKLAGGLAAAAALATAGTVLAVTGFRDLGTVHPNYNDIQFAVDKGWFQGYDDGTFRPDRVVSDAHLARVMRRAFPQGATRAELATFLRGGYERLDTAARLPGQGVSLTMARASWSTGYFQAALYRALLQELGYEVSDPADLELGPSLAYLAMAEGDADFWVNSWYPGHNRWLENELPDGSKVGDHLTVVGEQMPAGGLQGYLITKSFAEKYDIATLDDLNDNPAAIRRYDAQDANPGNGVAEIYGCPELWTCDDIIQSQIAFSGWENIDQVTAGYDAMFAEAVAKANKGAPMVAYTWTPSTYITRLRPGDNVLWVGVEDVLDDSNPLGREGGEKWDQRPGTAALSPDSCPDAAERGTCQLGWVAADILVTARNDLLENHPAAAKLLELVELNVVDVSLQVVAQDGGEDPVDLAEKWIADNQAKVDDWLYKAIAAHSRTGEPGEETSVTIGYISLGDAVPFVKLVSDGIKEEADRLGVNLIFCDSEIDAAKALACAQYFAVRGVQGVLNFQVFQESSSEFCAAHGDVPVIAIEFSQPPCQTAFMGANNRLAGQLGGRAMGKFISDNFDCDYTAYVSLESTAAGAANRDRMGGYREGFTEFCPIVNERVLDGADRTDPASTQMTNLLTVLPGNRIVVVAINEDGILGAIRAAGALGRQGDLYYSGQGTDPGIWCEIKNNDNYVASVAYFPEDYGKILIPAILNAVAGRSLPGQLFTDHRVVTRYNIDDIYDTSNC